MFPLPTNWATKSIPFIDPQICIYGFAHNQQDLSYGFYLSNFTNVWLQELLRDDLIQTAHKLGFEDASSRELTQLIKLLSEGVTHEDKLSFVQQNQENITCELKLDEINWSFKLTRQKQDIMIEFLAKLNYQQFANHSYLLHLINHLENVILIKDTYIRFLVENFKQSHGLELINNYKRMNKTDIEAIEKFDIPRWEKRNAISYRKSQSSHKKKPTQQELTKIISNAVNSTSWKFANLFYQDIQEESDEELSPRKFDALESTPMSSPIKMSNPTQVPKLTHTLSSTPTTSPQKKRVKIGALTSKRKAPSQDPPSSPAQIQSSPVKKKPKIGALGPKRR